MKLESRLTYPDLILKINFNKYTKLNFNCHSEFVFFHYFHYRNTSWPGIMFQNKEFFHHRDFHDGKPMTIKLQKSYLNIFLNLNYFKSHLQLL